MDGLILPGITRHSLIQLAKSWKEFNVREGKITMPELRQLINENRVLEVFGSGTAAVISPVNLIEYMGEELHIPTMEHKQPIFKRLYDELTDIQYGRKPHQWADLID